MPLAREIFQEGLIIPPMRLMKRGQIDAELLALILANVRTPSEREGDLSAQIAANRVGEARLLRLIERIGLEKAERYGAATQDYAERVLRGTVAAIPDGCYEFSDALDDDGFGNGPLLIRCAIRIEGDEVTVDFSGSDPETVGGVNANSAITISATLYCFRCLIEEDVLYNDGIEYVQHSNTPIEALEQALPVRVRRYALRSDSGGNGEYAGGDGLVREYEMLSPTQATLLTNGVPAAPTAPRVDRQAQQDGTF